MIASDFKNFSDWRYTVIETRLPGINAKLLFRERLNELRRIELKEWDTYRLRQIERLINLHERLLEWK